MKNWSFALGITRHFPAHHIKLITGSPAGVLFACFCQRCQKKGKPLNAVVVETTALSPHTSQDSSPFNHALNIEMAFFKAIVLTCPTNPEAVEASQESNSPTDSCAQSPALLAAFFQNAKFPRFNLS